MSAPANAWLPELKCPTPSTEPEGQSNAPLLTDYLYNDHGNACRLLAMYGEDLRYCHAFKKWLVWDGMRWAVDDTDQARRLAKQAGDVAEEFFDDTTKRMGRHPVETVVGSVAVGIGIGIVIGWLIARK